MIRINDVQRKNTRSKSIVGILLVIPNKTVLMQRATNPDNTPKKTTILYCSRCSNWKIIKLVMIILKIGTRE